MKNKAVKSLEMLTKLRRLEMLEKHQALAQMQAKLQTLNAQVKEIAQARKDEIECTRHDSMSRITLQQYLEGLLIKSSILKKQIFQLADFMIPVQESVRESFKQVKSLEITKEKIQTQINYEQDLAEQNFLDEISQNNKVRNTDD